MRSIFESVGMGPSNMRHGGKMHAFKGMYASPSSYSDMISSQNHCIHFFLVIGIGPKLCVVIFFLLAMKKGDISQDILDKSSNKTQPISPNYP